MMVGNTLVDTEALVTPHIMWETSVGAPLVIAFTGHARGLNELANFEFVKATSGSAHSKIFIRDPYMAYYHLGIDANILNAHDLLACLRELITTMRPSRITCVGVSAGGYGSILFGHWLKVDSVHAFGPQVILYEDWGREHDDPTIYKCKQLHTATIAPENDFRDLKEVIKDYNGKTVYKVHIGEDCQQDLNHANHIASCPGVEVVRYPCDSHACASQMLRARGTLGQVILS